MKPHNNAKDRGSGEKFVMRMPSKVSRNAISCSSSATTEGGNLAIRLCKSAYQTGFNFLPFCCSGQSLYQRQRKIHCSTRAARSDQFAIFNHAARLLLHPGEGIQRAGEAGGMFADALTVSSILYFGPIGMGKIY